MAKWDISRYSARMTATEQLLIEIESFCQMNGLKASTLARKAVNDGKLPERLRAGGRVTLETAQTLRDFMKTYPRSRPERRAAHA